MFDINGNLLKPLDRVELKGATYLVSGIITKNGFDLDIRNEQVCIQKLEAVAYGRNRRYVDPATLKVVA